METKKVQDMFYRFNQKYFWGKLDKVKLNWSKNMTLCAGKTYCKERQGNLICSIYLSEPLLSQRPPEDTVNTLLHEMIHAYLFVAGDSKHKMGHGPKFREHMTRINKLHGSKITVFHNFQKEVDKFRIHVYRCDGPCAKKGPYFGVLRRAITRPPGRTDKWWTKHSQECGGTYHKVEASNILSEATQKTQKPLKGSPSFSVNTPSPKCTPSMRLMEAAKTPSSAAMTTGGRVDSSDSMTGVRKKLTFSQERNTDNSTFEEEQLVQKIKERHAHNNRAILLSKKETRMMWRGPSPERGTLVEGRVNYNYRIKSGFKFNIHKYLERYRAAKKAEERASQKIDMYQNQEFPPVRQKSSRPEPIGAHTSKRMEGTKVSRESPDKTSPKTSSGSHTTEPAAVMCWNCGVNVMVPERVQLSQEVKKESACNTPKVTPQKSKEDARGSVSSTLVQCPSCGGEIPANEFNSHLDECLMPFTDEF